MAAIVGIHAQKLMDHAAELGKSGKGILSPGESTRTMAYRLAPKRISLASLAYPQATSNFVLDDLIFNTPGAVQCLSGVLLSPDDLDRTTATGQRFVDKLREKDVLPGVRVDRGIDKLDGTNGVLRDLDSRCQTYYRAGARFAKWCAVFKIGPSQPSQRAINENVNRLAHFAITCQRNGLVPIVEPEILADGDHDIHRCAEVTERVLAACYKALFDRSVLLEGTVLKLNMVTPGSNARSTVAPKVVAEHTLRALQRTVPAAVRTVLLFSGQSEWEAPRYLNAMIVQEGRKPWRLSFSFGRRVSTSTMRIWDGKVMDTAGVRAAFLARCTANSQATQGTYREPQYALSQLAQLRIQ